MIRTNLHAPLAPGFDALQKRLKLHARGRASEGALAEVLKDDVQIRIAPRAVRYASDFGRLVRARERIDVEVVY